MMNKNGIRQMLLTKYPMRLGTINAIMDVRLLYNKNNLQQHEYKLNKKIQKINTAHLKKIEVI